MPTRKPIVSYLRVMGSHDDLGLEAQREAIHHFAEVNRFRVVDEFVERHRGESPGRRPQLSAALGRALEWGCPLIAARLDRLARDPNVLGYLVRQGTSIIVATEPPVTLQVFHTWSPEQRAQSGQKIKRALAEMKARGVKLGNPTNLYEAGVVGREAQAERARRFTARVMPIIDEIQASGVTSYNGIAKELNRRNIAAPRGGNWAVMTVKRIIERGRHRLARHRRG